MEHPDFDAYNAARREERTEAPEFVLGGKTWTCVPGAELDAGRLVDALANDDVPFAHAMLRESLGLETYQKLLEHCSKAKPPIVMDTLVEVARWLVAAYTGRPTQPSPSTADGRSSDGDGSKNKSRRKASAA